MGSEGDHSKDASHRLRHSLGTNDKNPPKIRLKKIRETYVTVQYDTHAVTGNGNYVFAETCSEKIVKLIGQTYCCISLISVSVKHMQSPETEIMSIC